LKLPALKIEGRSGCFLELRNEGTIINVRKTSTYIQYNERLQRQAEKQKEFTLKKYFPAEFHTPNIFNLNKPLSDQLYWYEMEYIPGESYLEFLQRCSINELNTFCDLLIDLIENELSHSQQTIVSKELLTNKIEDVAKNIQENNISNDIISNIVILLSGQIKDLNIPIGFCHGDLTFSNMIFNNGKIYLVDFLDSFIESPLIDVVKIRQDTKFYWSMFIDNNKEDFQTGKIIQALRYLDNRINNHFIKYDFYKEHYRFFETLNLLRILPYLTNKTEIEFIIECINSKEN